MIYTPELLKAADHCQHRSFITNRYTGKRIAVDCGQCDYCIHKRAQKASMRVKTAGSASKHCWFVTLTYDNEHIPLFNCEVYHSEYDDVLSDSGVVYGYEKHAFCATAVVLTISFAPISISCPFTSISFISLSPRVFAFSLAASAVICLGLILSGFENINSQTLKLICMPFMLVGPWYRYGLYLAI